MPSGRRLFVAGLAVPLLLSGAAAPVLYAGETKPTAPASSSGSRSADDAALMEPVSWPAAADVADRQRSRASRGGAMRTFGTRYSPAEAVARLTQWAKAGVGGYPSQCLRLADDAYAATGPRTGTALMQWYRAKAAGLGHVKDMEPPIGAQLFWETSSSAGHIATYVGDGKVATNMPGGSIEIVRRQKVDEWGPYLGWAEPYYA